MLVIEFKTAESEVLIALLSVFFFEGFQEFDDRVEAYIDDQEWDNIQNEVLLQCKDVASLGSINRLPEKNWNQEWESSFKPVIIDNFCAIRASFHESITTCEHEIVIDPRMAFGTGHHETTELMMRQMRALELKEKAVLDLGCGTGILAILAAKCHASPILAVDNDPEAVSNSKENAEMNGVSIESLLGTADLLPSGSFDVILANINRNTLIDIFPDMRRTLKSGGTLLLSGILQSDKSIIEEAARATSMTLFKEALLGEWICLRFK